jgi:hypothetical protein
MTGMLLASSLSNFQAAGGRRIMLQVFKKNPAGNRLLHMQQLYTRFFFGDFFSLPHGLLAHPQPLPK